MLARQRSDSPGVILERPSALAVVGVVVAVAVVDVEAVVVVPGSSFVAAAPAVVQVVVGANEPVEVVVDFLGAIVVAVA